MLGRYSGLLVAGVIGALALVIWRAPLLSAGETPAPPEFASPFPAGQPWLITCGYTSAEDEETGACGHSGSQWNRYALDFQHVGGPKAARGQPVLAAAGGRVSRAGWQDGLGWHVLLDHGDGYTTVYGHMLAKPLVRGGEDVAQGDVLGRVGCTGHCTGPHIHFALWHAGVSVPPEPLCGLRDFEPGQVIIGCATVTSDRGLRALALGAGEPLTPAVADFDGDGGQDTAFVYAGAAGAPRVDVLGFRQGALALTSRAVEQPDGSDARFEEGARALAGDFDGDGRTDLATLVDEGDCGARVRVYLAQEDHFHATDPAGWWAGAPFCPEQAHRAASGDFNGDGRADVALILAFDDGALRIDVLLSNGERLIASPEGWWHGDNDGIGGIFHLLPGDFNGDGRTDLAAFAAVTYGCGSHVQVFLSTGVSFSYRGPERWWADEASCAYLVPHAVSGDFDGDGLVDDLAFLYESGTYFRRIDVLLSDGERFEQEVLPWWFDFVLYPPTHVRALMPADLDGDGRTDIAALYDHGECRSSVTVLFSLGERFAASEQWSAKDYCPDAIRAALP